MISRLNESGQMRRLDTLQLETLKENEHFHFVQLAFKDLLSLILTVGILTSHLSSKGNTEQF